MKQKYDVYQKGNNPEYPKEANIWSFSQPIPEWLLDRAMISKIEDDTGKPILLTRERNTGEIEILASGGREVLITLKNKDSIILFSSTHPLLTITKHQLDLLYELNLRI